MGARMPWPRWRFISAPRSLACAAPSARSAAASPNPTCPPFCLDHCIIYAVVNKIRRPPSRHLVGDLLRELVAASELLAHDLEDVFRVAVVLGKDERLGHLATSRKDVCEEPVSERANDEPDLVPGDNLPVEVVRIVGDILVWS